MMGKLLRKIYSNEVLKSVTFLVIILGPVIDVFTGLTNHLPVSIGIIIKVAFVGYMLFYMIFLTKYRWIVVYIFATLLFITVNLILVVSNYGVSYAFSNLVEIFKTFFFTYSLIWLYLLYKKLGFVIRWNDLQFIFMVIFFIFVLSIITQTDYRSYSWSSASSGWFFSANEISAILASIFPIGYIAIIKTQRLWIKFILASIIIFFSLIVGTRAVFYAAMGLYVCVFIYYVLSLMIHKEAKVLINVVVVIFSMGVTMLVYPISPAASNTSSKPVVVTPGTGNNNGNNGEPGYIEEILDEIIDIGGAISGDNSSRIVVALNSLLKNRIIYWANTHKIYVISQGVNKIFGIGSFIEEKGSSKQIQIEMDFFTIFYRYGIIGFLLYLIPLLYVMAMIIKRTFKYPRMLLSFEFLALCYSIAILLGLSFLAGHVLVAPSASIYLAICMLAVLDYADRLTNKSHFKEKVTFISSAGGHLAQLMKLQALFEDYDTVLITEDLSINHSIKTSALIRFLPYGSRADKGYFLVFFKIFFLSLVYFIIDRPQVVVTTGTHTAVPLALLAKIFNRKLIYIESFAKRTSPNLAGRILYPFADVMVVQWEPMLKVYKKAENWGWIY